MQHIRLIMRVGLSGVASGVSKERLGKMTSFSTRNKGKWHTSTHAFKEMTLKQRLDAA